MNGFPAIDDTADGAVLRAGSNHCRNSRRLGFAAVLALLCLSLFGCATSEQLTSDAERAIAASPRLTELDQICDSIPKPPEFRQVQKRIGNTYPLIVNGFVSDLKQDDAVGFFRTRLEGDGWEFEKDGEGLNSKWIRFRKGDRTVTISWGWLGDANYAIGCAIP